MKQQPQRRRRRAPKREEVSTTHVRKGIFCLMILLGVVSFCAVAGMLVKLMLVDHDYYEAKAIRNQTRSTSVTASRGTIYDRNGNVLAASSSVENVFLDPLELSQNKVDVPALAKKLAAVLDLDAGWIEEQAADTSLRYKVIKRRQAQEVCDKVREIIAEDKIIGVHLEPDSQRYYPYHDVAAQIIGFTNTENVGSEGLEAYYNDELQGTAGAVITTKGNYETQMLYSYEKYYQASDGDSIHLTLDTTVQYYLQKQMQDAVDRYDVLNGAFGIVMNCKTGEIVAMCTLGSYDPNDYQEIYDEDLRTQIEELYTKAEKQPAKQPEKKKHAEPEYPAEIEIDDFFKCKLQVARVMACEKVEKSKKLLKFQLSLGKDGTRTVVSGIAQYYTPEELVGRQVVLISNLKTAKLAGIESQGMILSAVDAEDHLKLVSVQEGVEDGAIIG